MYHWTKFQECSISISHFIWLNVTTSLFCMAWFWVKNPKNLMTSSWDFKALLSVSLSSGKSTWWKQQIIKKSTFLYFLQGLAYFWHISLLLLEYLWTEGLSQNVVFIYLFLFFYFFLQNKLHKKTKTNTEYLIKIHMVLISIEIQLNL